MTLDVGGTLLSGTMRHRESPEQDHWTLPMCQGLCGATLAWKEGESNVRLLVGHTAEGKSWRDILTSPAGRVAGGPGRILRRGSNSHSASTPAGLGKERRG